MSPGLYYPAASPLHIAIDGERFAFFRVKYILAAYVIVWNVMQRGPNNSTCSSRLCGHSAGDVIRLGRPLSGSDRDGRGVQLGRRRLRETGSREHRASETTQTDRASAGGGGGAGEIVRVLYLPHRSANEMSANNF